MTRLGIGVIVLLSACSRSEGRDAAKPLSSADVPVARSAAPALPSAAASASASTPGAAPAVSADALVATKACRAITVKGNVTAEDGRKVVAGDPIDRPAWLDLDKGATMAVKDADTSREVVLHGPGRVVPCDHGEERFLMATGRAVTATSAGARPGAEVLIATPFGVVRYGDAALDVRVAESGLRVQASVGDAFIDLGDGSVGQRVSAGGHAERTGAGVDVKALVAECDKGALGAESLARDVLSPGNSTVPLGERAKAHVQARKAARMKCAIAAAALGTMKMGPDRDDLNGVVARAEARWRGVPGASRRREKREEEQ